MKCDTMHGITLLLLFACSTQSESVEGSGTWANDIEEYDFDYFGKEAFEPMDESYNDVLQKKNSDSSYLTAEVSVNDSVFHLPIEKEDSQETVDDLQFEMPEELEPIIPGGSKFEDLAANKTETSGSASHLTKNHPFNALFIICISSRIFS